MKWINILKGLVLVMFVVFTACKQDDIVINEPQEGDMQTVSFAGPAASFSLSVFDFIDDLAEEGVFVDDEGLLYYEYREPVFINWASLVTLRDVNERWTFSAADLASPLKLASAEPAFSQEVVLSHQDDVRYDSLTLLDGVLDLSFEVPTGFSGNITVKIPQARTASGQVLSLDFTVDAFGNASSTEVPLSLVDFYIEFGNADVEPYNSHIDIEVYPNLSLVGIPGGGALALNFSLTGLSKASAYGYFGDQTAIREDAELEFPVFDEIDDLAGKVEMGDFFLDIDIYNSIGVPFYVEASNIRFFQKDSDIPDSYLLIEKDDVLENKAVLDYIPSAIDTDPLTPGLDSIKVSGSNSNIVEIGNSYPVRMMVDLLARSNPPAPQGVEPVNENFMHTVEELQADLVVRLPFWFKTSGYARMDTIAFDFLDIIDGSEDEVDHIDVAKIFFDFKSTLPVNVLASAWVIDAQGEKVDDLLNNATYIIKGGTATTPGVSAFEIGLTGDQIRLFKERAVKEIVLSATLATGDAEGEMVKIMQNAAIDGTVSFDFSGNIPN